MVRILLASSLYLLALIGGSVLLGRYLYWALRDSDGDATGIRSRLDRITLLVVGRRGFEEMTWHAYAASMLSFNVLGLLLVYALQRAQGFLPLNPNGLANVPPELALNTASSFASNTNWQAYGGETTMSHLTQMLGLTSQNFLSAATGIAVLLALTRGFTRVQIATVGNFWRDATRSAVLVLLPLSFLLAVVLGSEGVVQTFQGSATVTTLDPNTTDPSATSQTIAVGPVASQLAIKQLGTNGGGYFNVNSAHPFENPTPLTNALELIAILIIPGALCFTFGELVKDRRQGWALFMVMLVVFVPAVLTTIFAELRENQAFPTIVDASMSGETLGGNMEGKETRFGPAESAIWAVATTAASNGSVNSMHDSFTPLGGFVPMLMMQLGEIIFGGVGSGLYGLLAFVLVAVFVGGLMVGRTPEYLGKKVEPFEMKMVSLVILMPPILTLVGTACGVVAPSGAASFSNPGPHAFSQVLYAYSSMGNNNGSAFAGFGAGIPLHTLLGAAIMFLARFWLMIPMLALAGSLAAKKRVPPSAGTLPTHTPLFIFFCVTVILIVGALTFFPALALGPIAEELTFNSGGIR